MHLILTGATGLVGSGVLDAMIKMKDVTKISVLSRRPIPMAEDVKDPRVNVIIHKDFEKYDSDLLNKVNGAIINNLSREYIKITKDFTLRAAEAFQTLGSEEQPFNFVFVSGEGTTHNPGRFTPIFGRVKGETEKALAEMRKANPSFHASSIRPAFVDAAHHDAIKPYIPAQGLARDAMLAVLGPPVRAFLKGSWSPTLPMGRFMTEMAMGKFDTQMRAGGPAIEKIGEFPVLGNSAFRRLAGLDGDKK
ncbi:nucleoside-diphosphate-sugar epimerase [Diaporthe amygdali]|uniref:nucleoside-diphosphate-sugar epimerase n=1 Tax=Phomopsis amygdali TaxID=1214568 RepID=UPI0022FE0E3C|nr:nucleoside-diphosphate-sugar epimerase [Diaporthe amygdali]KAJ0115616.1 nucleoside-diphosphate-sugar epimerase [Diaporthe amygdali]